MVQCTIIASLFAYATLAVAQSITTAPQYYVLPWSRKWDGPDGPWASFYMNVDSDGQENKGQNFRAFPSFSLSVILLPLAADFCNGSRSANPACGARNTIDQGRSHAWEPNATLSWQPAGNVNVLSALSLSSLSNDGRATPQPYGSINVGTDQDSAQSIVLVNQTVVGTASKTFFMAVFGLSNVAFNLGQGKTTTFLTNFQNEAKALVNLTSSLSYTAGSYIRHRLPNPEIWPPSLIFGGYDSTRFDSATTLEVDLRDTTAVSDPYQLAVNISAITIDRHPDVPSRPNEPTYIPNSVPIYVEAGLTVNIDPVTPQLWLPTSACAAIATALGLQWDESTQLYLVDGFQHFSLLRQNYSITFSLSSARLGGAVKNFTLPYTAFDLNITYPHVDNWSYYFPLKRASRPDQYVLGRAFLQETHISVDYDSGYFNLSKATAGNEEPNIIPILPRPTTPSSPPRLSTGAYAGIGVGSGIAVLLLGFLVLAWIKKRWPFKHRKSFEVSRTHYEKPELHDGAVPRVEAMEKERVELEAQEARLEVAGVGKERVEIEGSIVLHEMDGIERIDMDFRGGETRTKAN